MWLTCHNVRTLTQQLAGVQIGAVHIIDSVPQGEYATGRLLFEEVQPLGYSLRPHIETRYSREETRAGFLNRLAGVLPHLLESGRAPTVHIEAHGLLDDSGNSMGFALASGEPVLWAELEPILKKINLACCLNLLVVAGACEGMGLAVVLRAFERAPAWGILGPSGTIKAGVLEAGHQAFYRTLYRTRDFVSAIQAMNASVPEGDAPFFLFSAQWFFTQVMKAYFEQNNSEEAIVSAHLKPRKSGRPSSERFLSSCSSSSSERKENGCGRSWETRVLCGFSKELWARSVRP